MPTTISDLESKFGIIFQGPKGWCKKIPSTNKGIYVISMSNFKEKNAAVNNILFEYSHLTNWLKYNPKIELNGKRPTPQQLKQYLSGFWHNDESILYIGQTHNRRGLKQRLRRFYRHKIGRKRPHSGGQWIKTLNIINSLSIYWFETNKAYDYEERMLVYFSEQVSNKNIRLPFANLKSDYLKILPTKAKELRFQSI